MPPSEKNDRDVLIREKYAGDEHAPGLVEDLKRLKKDEPLAYVIGHIPFLGLRIALDSRPLIPRPETEWWTELLISHIQERAVSVLDLCAGSGAIGLAVLAHCKNARVAFGEVNKMHREQIKKNLEINNLDVSRASIRSGDLFEPFSGSRFDLIATNPPYIPEERALEESVTEYEPKEALYGGPDGLSVIRRIILDAPLHLLPQGELWMECDIENIEEAAHLVENRAPKIHNDQYGRPRLLVAYY